MIFSKGYQPIEDTLDVNNPPRGGSGLLSQIKKLSELEKKYQQNKWNNFYIGQIEQIRNRNNKNWMDILKLAFQYAPDEAKKIMADITECDAEINSLGKKLSEE